jgi:CDP-diacylglycerol--glycerol-3-phosphate 3-phosphatidyltransferase
LLRVLMQTNHSVDETRLTLTDQMRVRFKGLLDTIGTFLNRLGINPNTLTMIGLAGNFIGALFLAQGKFLIGGLIILSMGPVDALDGTMARLRGEPSDFGGFVDSVVDRYSELIIFGGLLIYYIHADNPLLVSLTFIAAAGSFLVPYVRARAEALGFNAKVGILTRMERFLILTPSLVLSIPWLGIGIVALFANITAFQRIFSVRKQAREMENE